MKKKIKGGISAKKSPKVKKVSSPGRKRIKEYEHEKPVNVTTAEDPALSYYAQVNDSLRTVILGVAGMGPESQMTPLEKMDIARVGITKMELEKLKRKTELDYDKLAKALSVSRATLINKKDKEKFGSALSEKIVSLADIYSYGYEVFEEEGRFNQWMFRANRALGGQSPYDLIDNQFGREEVKDLIGRIDYGVYS
jgi:putative toxin-antitoxin system antitoxin component (TIGR02293 family)